MAPIPPRKKQTITRKPQQIGTDDVYDGLGRSLSTLLTRQSRTNRKQENDITVNRQHASQYESDHRNKLIFRDVFPARKYDLTLSDTSWMGDDNVVIIGYTVRDAFTQLSQTSEIPENNVFHIQLPGPPDVPAIDTLEVRMVGAAGNVRGYLEDANTSSSILQALASLAETITGVGGLSDRVDELERIVQDHEERIRELEGQ